MSSVSAAMSVVSSVADLIQVVSSVAVFGMAMHPVAIFLGGALVGCVLGRGLQSSFPFLTVKPAVDLQEEPPSPSSSSSDHVIDPDVVGSPWRQPMPPNKVWIFPSKLEAAMKIHRRRGQAAKASRQPLRSLAHEDKLIFHPKRCRQFIQDGLDTGSGVEFILCDHCKNMV